MIDDGIGDLFPSLASVREWRVLANREHGVEQQDSVSPPVREISGAWGRDAKIGFEFAVDILERGRERSSLGDRECQTMSLSGAMIGILSQDEATDLLRGGEFEGAEQMFVLGKDGVGLALGFEKSIEIVPQRSGNSLLEMRAPGRRESIKKGHERRAPSGVLSYRESRLLWRSRHTRRRALECKWLGAV